MKVKAYGKVNLALDVCGHLPHGYHELDMIMAPIDLYDELTIEENERDVVICENCVLPLQNTLTKAMHVMRKEAGLKNHYRVELTKQIPSMAGIGGGSADAAALMEALNDMEHLGLSKEQLQTLAVQVGADVPFCLQKTYARVRGIGEEIIPIDSDWTFPILLVQPSDGVITPACFQAWDQEEEHTRCDVELVANALKKEDVILLYSTMANSLEPIAWKLLPSLETVQDDLYGQEMVRVMMTGSGSCMMGFSVDEQVLDHAAAQLAQKYPFVQIVHVGKLEEA